MKNSPGLRLYAEAVDYMNTPASEQKAINKLNEMSKYVRELQGPSIYRYQRAAHPNMPVSH